MENIIAFKGNVKYQITLDPGVWIFDDRRVDLTTYFTQEDIRKNELEEYTKAVSKHWDREIMEGAVFPPTLKTEKKFEKEKVLTGTFGIPFKPFLMNAEPKENAEIVIIESEDGEARLTLPQAEELILGFSKDGKPLKEDGPVHVYYGDGSNQNSPIKRVKAFRVE
ncbi:peptidyl-prolyl cis-trans isomerase [Cytobacillus firmus]|uniref:peptidyl-prolyl cis-trans isomerase n=1 Tax=Cytobacillus firmus TaxID=1399 RepID=UPI0022281A40|nr:peptidyl-prolyl cis-trans isomerase [Cytobacillus firmus]MDM5226372.1 peptidyl-prolyl cis-trans isomerase [Cytobacillus sp. NJ13]